MELAKILLLAVVPLLIGWTSGALQVQVTNVASNTPGGARFNAEIGLGYCKTLLSYASSLIWSTSFNQLNEADRKPINFINLTINSFDGKAITMAYPSKYEIILSSDYIAKYSGDVKTEITGVLYYAVANVWQWDGQGQAPGALVEGIANVVRFQAGYMPSNWVKPGRGDRWDQGDSVTAQFLIFYNYHNTLDTGFVTRLNAKMRNGYSVNFFKELLGKSVDQLWSDYKAFYGQAPGALVEGIANVVRFQAGYMPSNWVKPGRGDRWDQGDSVTAQFLIFYNYHNTLDTGFVTRLNAKMRNGYSVNFFKELLGKSVDQLWSDYKAFYG